MRLLFISLMVVLSALSAHAEDSVAAARDMGALWSPVTVEWQVVKSKNKTTLEDVCVIRWVYDKSVYLSFLEKDDNYIFQISSKDGVEGSGKFPKLVAGQDYYGVLIKRNDSITQISSHAFDENSMSIAVAKDIGATEYFKSAEKISLFFDDAILNLPLANAVENYSSYESCVDSLKETQPSEAGNFIPENENAPDLSSVDVGAASAPAPSLVDRAAENLGAMSAGLTVPPNLPAFRLSQTKRTVMDKQKELEQNGEYKEINKDLIKKLRLLEREKEELRRKLLTVTQESFIPGLMACEPGAGDDDSDLSEVMEESYKATIERLQVENREIRGQLASCNGN